MTQFMYGKATIFTCFKTVTCLFLLEFGYSIFFFIIQSCQLPQNTDLYTWQP